MTWKLYFDVKVFNTRFTNCIYSIIKTIKKKFAVRDLEDCTKMFSGHVWASFIFIIKI